MGIWLGPLGKPTAKQPPKFSTTGELGVDYLYAEETGPDGIVHFEIAVLNPCAFVFSRVVPLDLCLVGAGKNGSAGSVTVVNGNEVATGGDGGPGGKILRVQNFVPVNGTSYLINPGVNEADTTGFNYSSANGSSASTDGTGAVCYANGDSTAATAGSAGEYAFNSASSLLFPGRRYGAKGGGAGAWNSTSNVVQSQKSGGQTGAGRGGIPDFQNDGNRSGANGNDNTGSGAGGGAAIYKGWPGGLGGSGILLIRDAR